jgi:small subunit ribosomal protein S5
MIGARPLRWILAASLRSPGTTVRTLSNTPRVEFPRRRPQDIIRGQQQLTPRTASYSAADLEELKSHFTPDQLSALLTGESAIDRTDFERRAQRRGGDPLSLKYLDDLSTLDPVLDLLPEGAQLPKTKNEWISPPQRLPPINDPDLKYSEEDQEGDMLRNLAAHTGMPMTELKNVRSRIMVMHSVTNQTRMGKIRKVYCLAVAGNGNGLLGVGEGKATEGEDAIRQATYMAIRNMEPIPRYEGRTIYGDVEVKQGAVEMKVFTRPPGG